MERDQHGGYTFTDDKGVMADYPPGAVLSVPALTTAPVLANGGKSDCAELKEAARTRGN